LNAAKEIILLLWLLLVATLGNVSAFTPGAGENCIWEKSLATGEMRPVEPSPTAGGRQENEGATYDVAPDYLLAAEATGPREMPWRADFPEYEGWVRQLEQQRQVLRTFLTSQE